MKRMFGIAAQKARVKLGKTLRSFCSDAGLDPSYWSKVERGVLPPPSDEKALESLGRALGVSEGHLKHWKAIAAISRNSLPSWISEDEDIMHKLPLFLSRITYEKLEGFIEELKRT